MVEQDYSTKTKVKTVFRCESGHLIAGIVILKEAQGYICPYCRTKIEDVTDTQEGKEYYAFTRTDLHSPPPLRTPSS